MLKFDGTAKRTAKKVLLMVATLVVGVSLAFELTQNKASAHSTKAIEMERTEFALRLNDSVMGAIRSIYGSNSLTKGLVQDESKLLNQSLSLLETCSNQSPQDPLIAANAFIISEYLGNSGQLYLDRIGASKSQGAIPLHDALKSVYEGSNFNTDDAQSIRKQLEASLRKGWFENQAVLVLYKKSEDKRAYEALKSDLSAKSFTLVGRLAMLGLIALIPLLGGAIVLLTQLPCLWRGVTPEANRAEIAAPANYGWMAVLSVFVAWLATQIIVGAVGHPLVKSFIHESPSAMAAASITFFAYALSQLPVLLFIYYFAIKPNHVNFADALKLRFHTKTLSNFKIVACGVLAWMAALPLMLVACYIAAQFFGAQGSSNPIIAIVTEAAKSDDLFATVMLYATLGILAPLCEESLFRGFLYTYLRRRWPVAPSAMVSAGLFASIHFDPGALAPLFCLGCVFCFVLERTKSVIPSMIAHGLWNSCTFTLVLVLFGYQ
jgi:membrane protease YdiL (CAAX protease family)